jgi:predicted Zn-dependent peptidase
MNTLLTTLPGGLRVATSEVPHAETVAMGIWAGVGGRHEPAEWNGISHFIEHMLFKGTARRTAKKIMEQVEGVGGDINAYTSEERTCYYAAAAAEHFPKIADVLCDIYVAPKFAPTDIERERGVIGEEILMYRDEPSSHVQEMLNEAFWPKHPLGRPLTGTLDTIERFQRDDFLAYRATHYHAASTVVTAAGRVAHEDVVERVAKALAELPGGRRPSAPRPPKPAVRPRFAIERRDTQQTQVAIGIYGPSAHDDDRFAFHLLHIVLGGNGSSRLFQDLREKRGLCYSVSSQPSTFADTGMLNISLGLDHRNLAKSLALILTAFEKLRTEPVGTAELRRAKEYAIGTSRMSLERTSSQNMRLGNSVLTYGRVVTPDIIHDRIRAVTAEQILAVARKFLDPATLTLAVIGPSCDESNIARFLQ